MIMIKNSAQPQLGMEFWIQLERARRLVKNPNMDYRNLHTTNLFRDIMIILVVNIGRVGIQTADYYYNGAGIPYASNFH